MFNPLNLIKLLAKYLLPTFAFLACFFIFVAIYYNVDLNLVVYVKCMYTS